MKFKHRTSRGSAVRVVLVLAMIAGLFTVIAPAAGAFPNASDEGVHVGLTLEGCNLDHGGVFDQSTTLCNDAGYTTGDLGKAWAELDLVPHRVTSSLGTQADATTDYKVSIMADGITNGKLGYDVISVPVVNAGKSDASCAVTAGAQTLFGTAADPFGGGTDTVIYRDLSIHQNKGTTCVFDYYERLAIGAHLYPGSSLQSYLGDQADLAGAKKTVSIPTNEVAPQTLSKTMTASQGSDTTWTIHKTPTPTSVDLGNTCDVTGDTASGNVSVTVSWTKNAAVAGGPVTIDVVVSATNPAHRDLTVTVSDVIRTGGVVGSGTVIDTRTLGPTNIPAGTTAEVGSFEFVWNSPTGTQVNDVATGTYTDTLTGIVVPQTTTTSAVATIQNNGPVTNGSAVITDSESISGTGLKFSVDSTSGASGNLTTIAPFGQAGAVAYVLGTHTTGPVYFVSASQSGDSSVTFNKTVYFDIPSSADADGTLSDTASLLGSDGFTTSADASIDITSTSIATLTINKTTTVPVDSATTFTFDIQDSTQTSVGTVDVDFAAGDTSGTGTLSGLDDGSYTAVETASGGFTPAADTPFTVGAGKCDVSIDVANGFAPASAQAIKITKPDGTLNVGWEMILDGPGTPAGGEKVLTDSGGVAGFQTQLEEGDYTITETNQDGWTSDGGKGDCSFTVDYPADAGKVFSCTFTNTAQGHIIIKKVTDPVTDTTTQFEFDPSYSASNFFLKNGEQNDSGNLVPGTYSVSEVNIPTNWTLTGATCDDGSLVSAIGLSAGETVTCTFRDKFVHVSRGLTMGYWKNHLAPDKVGGKPNPICKGLPSGTSCSSNGPWTITYLPQSLGNYPVTTILEAAKVFAAANCSNTGNIKQQNQNAIGCLAGQLLAAELNVANGADHCADATIAAANAFLISIGYTGPTGNYSGITAAQRATAISLKTALDTFNNGTCPP
jgi:hypothetical protein